MFKHSRLRSCLNWMGQNLIISVVLVLGVIALWQQKNNPGLYFIQNATKEDAAYDRAYEESGAMSIMARSMGVQDGVAKMMMPEPAFADDFAPKETERKIVRNASLQVEVSDTEVARKLVEQKVAELNGHITNLNSYEVRQGILSYNFTVRIPAKKLEKTMDVFTNLGVKKSESINEQDITAQYTDTESRLKNLEVRRDRLRELMERDTDKLSDILQIDRELSNVQQQIENYERTLKRHDTNVTFSTINLSVQPEPQIGDFQTPEWTVKKSWKQSVNDLISSLKNIFDVGLKVLVFAPIWIPFLLVLWTIQRFIRRRTDCLIQLKK